MTLRQLIGAWLAALVLATVGVALLFVYAEPERHPFRNVQIAVIGSSLTRYAIPPRGGGASSLLGDGRTHLRFGYGGISEDRELEEFERALDDRVGLVLLEMSTFIRDMKSDPPNSECAEPLVAARSYLGQRKQDMAAALLRLRGIAKSQSDADREPANLNASQVIDPVKLKAAYPMRLHEPACHAWLADLLDRARRQGTRVAFFLPPRSRAADRYLPPGQGRQLEQLAIAVARDLRVPIFAPRSPWDNTLFVDHGHLNFLGRQRFDAELQDWWKRRK